VKYQFNQVAIVGVGLIGGSLGWALRDREIAKSVIGLGRNPARLALAKKKGAIDFGTTDWKSGVSEADVVVICTPVGKILPIIRELSTHFREGCLVTDVGSTKKSIVEGAEKIFRSRKNEVFFIGSHPMAGSEQFGIEAAKKDLYEGSICLVTPTVNSPEKEIHRIEKLWKSVGCRVFEISPELHDQSVAAVSHFPHIIAASLVNTVARLDKRNGKLGKLSAGGFRDTTRIASSLPEIWTDICMENQESILEAIHSFENELHEFKGYIQKKNSKRVYKKFQSAKKYRDKIYPI
jgi:prephenate dehydrogenase